MTGQDKFHHHPSVLRPRRSSAETPHAAQFGCRAQLMQPCKIFSHAWHPATYQRHCICVEEYIKRYLRGASAAACCRGLTWVVACDRLSVLCIKPPAMINLTTCTRAWVWQLAAVNTPSKLHVTVSGVQHCSDSAKQSKFDNQFTDTGVMCSWLHPEPLLEQLDCHQNRKATSLRLRSPHLTPALFWISEWNLG